MKLWAFYFREIQLYIIIFRTNYHLFITFLCDVKMFPKPHINAIHFSTSVDDFLKVVQWFSRQLRKESTERSAQVRVSFLQNAYELDRYRPS